MTESEKPSGGGPPAFWLPAWAVLGAALALAVALGPLEGIAHVQDEVVYSWQAQRIAEGRLSTPVPAPRAAQIYDFLLDTPRGRTGIFPLGWPLLLALGVRLGAAAWVNPLLHGLTVLLGGTVARRIGGVRTLWLAPPLLALSPQAVLLGASRMSHALAALLALAAVAAVAQPGALASTGRAALLGGALGALALVRPFDATVAALVLLPAALVGGRRRLRPTLACAGALALGALAVGAQNLAATGRAGTFAQTLYFDSMPPPVPGEGWRFAPGCNDLGFGPGRGCFLTWGSFGHTPAKAWRNVELNAGLASRLGPGSAWSLLLVVPALASATSRRFTLIALLLWLALAAGYSAYWYGGACYGARFWHAALPPLLIAVALGTTRLLSRLRMSPVLGVALTVPMALVLVRTLPELRGYWGIDDRFGRLAEGWDRGEALVLVAYRSEKRLTHPRRTTGEDLLVAPHRWRAAWFDRSDGALAFAEYQPELVDATRRAHDGRPTWIYEMAADPGEDRLRPLEPADRASVQRRDLDLPAPLPLLPAPRIAGDLWSGSFRIVEVENE